VTADTSGANPARFLREVVEPNVADVRRAPGDERLAVNAILTLDALIGQLFAVLAVEQRTAARNDIEFRDIFAHQCPDYRTLRDLAFAIKHGVLVHPTPRLVRRADSLRSERIGVGTMVAGDPCGEFFVIYIELESGHPVRAYRPIEATLAAARRAVSAL
jgi:hypothetical protein